MITAIDSRTIVFNIGSCGTARRTRTQFNGTRKRFTFVTGHNDQLWHKVMFLLEFVILFTGGWGCLPQCMLGYTLPPEQIPPGADTPPPGKQIPAYGLRAAGTHPTGMHSCSIGSFQKKMVVYVYFSWSVKLHVQLDLSW